MAGGSCGPIRPAPACSARPVPQPLPKKPSDRPTGTGGRSRGSQAGCSRTAPSGWSACRDLARRPACLSTCGCSRLDFPDGSHGVLIAAGNIALIAPRLAQAQSDNEMQPATASSEPPLSEPVLSEPVLSAGRSRACPSSSNRSRRNRLPITSSRHHRAKRPPGLRCSMRLPNLPLPTSRPRPKPFRPRRDHRARATTCHRSVCRPAGQARRLPLRFTWQMDREGRFTLGTDEFTGLIGPRTTAAFGRPWREIAETFGFDPTGRMMQAFATGATWSGITLNWPVDGGGTLPVELSGLPIFDARAKFHRLSRLRRLPRFRRHRAARRPAAGGIVRRNGDAARTVRCAICRAGQRCIAFIRRIA